MTRSRFAVLLVVFACFGASTLCTAGCRRSAAAKQEPTVKIEAYYPFNESHQFIGDYLKELEKKYPGQVAVELIDFRYPEGRERWMKTGLSCAGVFINGKTTYDVTRDGKTEAVNFIKRMGTFWTEADMEAVIAQLLGRPQESAKSSSKPAPAEKAEEEKRAPGR